MSSDCDDFWDCSSNEDNAMDRDPDSDSEDEHPIESYQKAYTKHVASCFERFFGSLPPGVDSSPVPSSASAVTEEGTIFNQFYIYVVDNFFFQNQH